MAYFQLVMEDDNGNPKLLETRSGDLPDRLQYVEVTLGSRDVELQVSDIEQVHLKDGKTWRVTLNPRSERPVPIS